MSMTEIFRDAKAADDFAEENKGREKRERNFAAINRPGNPVMKGTFTRTTPEKCLTFERDMLDFQQKYNVEVRYTNYVDTDLKYKIRDRFGLTDSDFYEPSQQELHRCLSEMIAPMTKSEFLSMLKRAVHLHYRMATSPLSRTLEHFSTSCSFTRKSLYALLSSFYCILIQMQPYQPLTVSHWGFLDLSSMKFPLSSSSA